MNYWKQIAEMLGVELGEEFDIDGFECNPYKMTEKGLINCNGCPMTNALLTLLNGKRKVIKKPWMPERGEEYYIVNSNGKTIDWNRWLDDAIDFSLFKCGWIFRTEAEAMKGRDRVLAEYKQVKKGETAS